MRSPADHHASFASALSVIHLGQLQDYPGSPSPKSVSSRRYLRREAVNIYTLPPLPFSKDGSKNDASSNTRNTKKLERRWGPTTLRQKRSSPNFEPLSPNSSDETNSQDYTLGPRQLQHLQTQIENVWDDLPLECSKVSKIDAQLLSNSPGLEMPLYLFTCTYLYFFGKMLWLRSKICQTMEYLYLKYAIQIKPIELWMFLRQYIPTWVVNILRFYIPTRYCRFSCLLF